MCNGVRGELRIGTSGYQYDHWAGVFYPKVLPRGRWFEHYAEHFDTVEINNTFYNLPAPETFDSWKQRAPKGFCYALKFSRYGSHLKRLRDPDSTIAKFTECADRLGRFLGPILVQLPPRWHADPQRLEAFLDAAPSKYRLAVEFRDRDWLCERVYTVLRRHRAALVIHDMMGEHPDVVTTNWVYFRFHGPDERYRGDYPHQTLSAYAKRIEGYISRGMDVFAYFNNDLEGHAVFNAADLRRYVMGS